MQDKKDKTNQARTLFSECSEEEKNKTISFLLGDREAFEEPVIHITSYPSFVYFSNIFLKSTYVTCDVFGRLSHFFNIS